MTQGEGTESRPLNPSAIASATADPQSEIGNPQSNNGGKLMENHVNQCAHVKPDGTRCRAVALKGTELCFYHNPATAEAHRDAVRKGALTRNSRRSHPWADSYYTLVQGAQTAGPVLLNPLLDAFLKVREGRMDTRTANTLAYLATIIAQMDIPTIPETGPPKTVYQIKLPKWEAVMRRCMNWDNPKVREVMKEMGISAPLPPDDPRMHEIILKVFPNAVQES